MLEVKSTISDGAKQWVVDATDVGWRSCGVPGGTPDGRGTCPLEGL